MNKEPRIRPPEPACLLLNKLQQAGHDAYIVGGCVRDSLLGRTPDDWDICTSARPEEMEALFAGYRLLLKGKKHGTVAVVLEGHSWEITTFRQDGTYTDGRHPDQVHFVPCLREDLARRDFTVNAMAWSPETGLVDLFGGQRDLQAGLLRCVGDPAARFDEDALRICGQSVLRRSWGSAWTPTPPGRLFRPGIRCAVFRQSESSPNWTGFWRVLLPARFWPGTVTSWPVRYLRSKPVSAVPSPAAGTAMTCGITRRRR